MSEKKRTKEEIMTVEYEVDGQKIKLSPNIVRDYITNGVPLSDPEYKYFVELARSRNLNPFLNEVYAIKYSEKQPATIVVGKDAIYKRANLHPQFDGMKKGIIVLNRKGDIEERLGTFRLPDEEVVGGWAEVFRKDRAHSLKQTVAFDEVAGRNRDGTLNYNWQKQGGTMVEKVASVRALRESFVEVGGMIDESEVVGEKNAMGEVEIIDTFEDDIKKQEAAVKVENNAPNIDDL